MTHHKAVKPPVVQDHSISEKKEPPLTITERFLLLKRGNIGLVRLLMIVNNASTDGISTVKLFQELGSTGYGQTVLKRALKEGLIERKEGEPPGPGQFPYKYNIITERGKKVLSQLEH